MSDDKVRKSKKSKLKSNNEVKVRMKRYLTLSELLKGDVNEPLFVLNTSSGAYAGNILFTVEGAKQNSTPSSVMIPNTFLPIDLAEQLSRVDILDSANFRTAIRNGAINPITAEYADKLNSSHGASEERERLGTLIGKIGSISRDNMVGTPRVERQLSKPIDTAEDNKVVGGSVKCQKILMDAETNQTGALNTLRTVCKSLSQNDLIWMHEQSKDLGLNMIYKFLSSKI